MERVHKNIIVSGEVQGVGYRYSCLQSARSIGIKGFIKNLQDGTVYIEAEGSDQQLFHFIKYCHDGSPHSIVTDLNIVSANICNYSNFDIK